MTNASESTSSETDSDEDIAFSTSTESQLATDATIMALTESGIEVVEPTDEMAEALLGNRAEMMANKKRALKTISVQEEHQPTVVSSADGTKVVINLAKQYEEKTSNRQKTFIGDLSRALTLRLSLPLSHNRRYHIAKNSEAQTIEWLALLSL